MSEAHPKSALHEWQYAHPSLAAVMCLGLWATFSVWTATSWLEFPRFLIATVLLFLLPGSLLVRWWHLDVTPAEHITLSIVLGMIATCSLYVVVAWLGHPLLLWLWMLAGVLGIIWRARSNLMDFRDGLMTCEMAHLLLLLALFISWLPLYFLPYYYGNLAWTEHGSLVYGELKDILLHASLAAELTHAFPPQVPFMAGEPLNYHVGMDLVAAVLNRYGGVSIVDLVTRFCPTLFITIDMLAGFCLARRFIGSGPAAVAAALLAVVGEDFSFIPGILQQSKQVWCAYFLQAPTVGGLYWVNSMVVGHGFLFAGLFCLHRSLADRRLGWIVAASLCSAALIQTKIFVFIHLILAMGLVMAVNLVAFRRLVFWRQATGILLASMPLLLYTFIANSGGAQIMWTWSSGLEGYVTPAFQRADWPQLAAYPVAGLAIYLALTYGFRILGLGELISSCRSSRERPFHLLLAVFVVLGPVLSLTSKLVPRDDPSAYNNAIWFMVESKYVATLFAVAALAKFWGKVGEAGRSAMIALVAAVSLASTAQFLVKMHFQLIELDAPAMETIGFLNREAQAGQVAVSRLDGPVLALTKLRLPFYSIFPYSFASRESVETRTRDMEEFWQSWGRGTIREDLLIKYHADWVVSTARTAAGGAPDKLPQTALGTLELQLVFTNGAYMVYRVSPS